MEVPTEKVVALVTCKNGIQHPALLFQVTLDPDRVWPGDQYIRFGGWSDAKGQGDELTGWMRLSDWEIETILGVLTKDGTVTVRK